VVADALSRKERVEPIRVRAMRLEVKVDLVDRVKEVQKKALCEENVKDERMTGQVKLLTRGSDEILRFRDRVWIPKVGDLRDIVLDEAHKSKYTVISDILKYYYSKFCEV